MKLMKLFHLSELTKDEEEEIINTAVTTLYLAGSDTQNRWLMNIVLLVLNIKNLS